MDDEGHEIEVEEEEVLEVPLLTRLQAALLLVVVTVFTGVTAEFLIGSIDGMTSTGGVSREFVALILLPLVSFRFSSFLSPFDRFLTLFPFFALGRKRR